MEGSFDYSIVIPVYNEEQRIAASIDRIFAFFASVPYRVEVLFVNDGSLDTTEQVLGSYTDKYAFRIISYAQNQGKGYAVRQGALAAAGDWVIFFDIDLATPLTEFTHLTGYKEPGNQIIIGSRRVAGAEIKKGESAMRTFLGQGFTKLSNVLVPGILDFTCGFKCFSRDAVKTIFPRARINRWGFDTELLYIAHLHKIPVRQMPVAWEHDDNSKVRVLNAIISSLGELYEMKKNQLVGYYR